MSVFFAVLLKNAWIANSSLQNASTTSKKSVMKNETALGGKEKFHKGKFYQKNCILKILLNTPIRTRVLHFQSGLAKEGIFLGIH